jgi:hypothetical protein
MLKLVILSPGMTGRTQDLKTEKTTIGRVDDNTFPIIEPSVSSHHCEVILRGTEVVVHDLDSTNGTYIAGEKITERALKPGQILRLGQVDLRLEADAAGAPPGKTFDRTAIIPGGVKLSELEKGARGATYDTHASGFSKKGNRVNQVFLVIGGVLGVVIILLLLYIATLIKR